MPPPPLCGKPERIFMKEQKKQIICRCDQIDVFSDDQNVVLIDGGGGISMESKEIIM